MKKEIHDTAGRIFRYAPISLQNAALDRQDLEKKDTVGFISAPAWIDPAVSEFPTVVTLVMSNQLSQGFPGCLTPITFDYF